MQVLDSLEDMLARVYKAAPALDRKTKQSIADIWPAVAILAGLLQIYASYSLWQTGHYVNKIVGYADNLSLSLTGKTLNQPHLGVMFYLGVFFLALSGIVMLLAFPKLQRKLKSGWDLLFLGIAFNLVYGILMLFVDGYNGPGRLIGSLVGATIGFYFLFQIRDLCHSSKTNKLKSSD